jgi:hypothetical protein
MDHLKNLSQLISSYSVILAHHINRNDQHPQYE